MGECAELNIVLILEKSYVLLWDIDMSSSDDVAVRCGNFVCYPTGVLELSRVFRKDSGEFVYNWMKHLECLSRNNVLMTRTSQRHPTGSVVCPTHQDLVCLLSCPALNGALRGNAPRQHIHTPHRCTGITNGPRQV